MIIDSTRIVGWPTLTGMLPEIEPHMPCPSMKSSATRSIFFKTSCAAADQRRAAHGAQNFPVAHPVALQNREKLNSPVIGLTEPPPIFLA